MTFWLAEHPMLPLYRAAKPVVTGKLGDKFNLLTNDVNLALQFPTATACEAWIRDNPHPRFVAREHKTVEVEKK